MSGESVRDKSGQLQKNTTGKEYKRAITHCKHKARVAQLLGGLKLCFYSFTRFLHHWRKLHFEDTSGMKLGLQEEHQIFRVLRSIGSALEILAKRSFKKREMERAAEVFETAVALYREWTGKSFPPKTGRDDLEMLAYVVGFQVQELEELALETHGDPIRVREPQISTFRRQQTHPDADHGPREVSLRQLAELISKFPRVQASCLQAFSAGACRDNEDIQNLLWADLARTEQTIREVIELLEKGQETPKGPSRSMTPANLGHRQRRRADSHVVARFKRIYGLQDA
ncbi:hypothetical protein T439DRAFT_381883 [Meredithblackwellia eburnea MCA 4105]